MFNGRRASAGEDEEVPDGIVGMVVQQCELFNTTTHKSGSSGKFYVGYFSSQFFKSCTRDMYHYRKSCYGALVRFAWLLKCFLRQIVLSYLPHGSFCEMEVNDFG